ASGSVYGPEVSYTVTGGFSSPPNTVGVRVCTISRIGTRMSGREPCTWILREPGIGRVTASDSCEVFWMRELGTAFIGIVLLGSRTRCVRQGSRAAGCGPGRSEGARQADCGPRTRQCNAADPAKLPYAGVNRIRFEGTVSTARPKATRYPRFCGLLNHSARRDAGPR